MENATPPARQAPPVAATVATTPAATAASTASAQPAANNSSGWTDTTAATPSSNSIQLGPADTRPWIGGTLGFATDNLDFGLGARGGVTLSNRIYIGGSFVYHIGSSSSSSAQGSVNGISVNASGSSNVSVLYVGPEGGYDFPLGPVIIRPYMGLGVAVIMASASEAGVTSSGSATKVVVWPGCSLAYNFEHSPFFVGGDIRFVTVPGGPSVGLLAFGGIHIGG